MRDDAPRVARRDLFGGRGEVVVTELSSDLALDPFRALLSCELEAGGSVGPHVQQEHPEVVVGLGGAGFASVDGERARLGPGDVVAVPHGAELSIENPGHTPLRYLIVKAADPA